MGGKGEWKGKRKGRDLCEKERNERGERPALEEGKGNK